jgi:D-sedoheptulose 7-phosphate isomerase
MAIAERGSLVRRVDELLERRTIANGAFFEREADRLARLCHRMAERFALGGRLVALAHSPATRSDARHVAVEFVHPVIVGKRALPAFAIAPEGGELARQVELLAEPEDILIAFASGEGDSRAADAVRLARERGCMTVAVAPLAADWQFEPPSEDPVVRQELVETLYHFLWELVHVFFEHRGLPAGRSAVPARDGGASSFLYPFLAERERGPEAVIADVRQSVLVKAEEVGALREQTLIEGRAELLRAAAALRATFDAGGKLLAFGNGGSATDAMDVVADFRRPPHGWPRRPALDLTEDTAIVTALANDIGPEVLFQRQVIAYGCDGDAVLAFSTSGSSGNIVAALAEARTRGLTTIALVGYDGGRVAAEGLADHAVVTRSEHIPRIQEAQASAYHVLRELVELVEPPGS